MYLSLLCPRPKTLLISLVFLSVTKAQNVRDKELDHAQGKDTNSESNSGDAGYYCVLERVLPRRDFRFLRAREDASLEHWLRHLIWALFRFAVERR